MIRLVYLRTYVCPVCGYCAKQYAIYYTDSANCEGTFAFCANCPGYDYDLLYCGGVVFDDINTLGRKMYQAILAKR